jgi:outer membrane receptor protein involved in Fe transport
MTGSLSRLQPAVFACLLGMTAHFAPAYAAEGLPSELDLFKLDEEVRETVTSITKTKQERREAPAVVSVITREEIRARGYRSVADALRGTAGFHVIDDMVMPDAGIRGTHAGPNGASRLIKVMIDGQPVDFRPTTGNAIGIELVPIEIVERIEIIRGPVSALYGADAFLGVVSIITRRGGDLDALGTSLRAGGMQVPRDVDPRAELGVTLFGGKQEGSVELLAAASYDRIVRSGLLLPASSPDAASYAGDPYGADDHAAPRSVYGRVGVDAGARGTFHLSGGMWGIEADGEWVDTAVDAGRNLALTHGTHVSLRNRHIRLDWTRPVSGVDLLASAAYSEGEVGPGDRIDVRNPSLVRVRRLSYRGIDLAAEGRWQRGRGFSIVGGIDYTIDLEKPQATYSRYTAPAGQFAPGDEILLAPRPDERTFTNFGAYGQLIYYPVDTLGITAGVRVDRHSLYELVPSGRLALVYLPGPSAYAKLLLGTSFKAPSDDQLYAQPTYEGALKGNALLDEQRATTGELVLGYDRPGSFAVSAAGFFTRVEDKVEFLPTGTALEANNVGRLDTMGVEVEGKVRRRITRAAEVSVWGNVSLVRIDKQIRSVVATTEDEPYPAIMANAGLDAAIPRRKVRIDAELNLVGVTPQTGSNRLIAERLGTEAEDLPAYALVSLAVSSMNWRPIGRKETILSARLTNALDTRYAQPGTGGNNIPGYGRAWWVQLTQQF